MFINEHVENKPWGNEVKTFCVLMHLSQLTNYFAPGLGLVLPIVMWAMNKDDNPRVYIHGKIIVNWLISSLNYSAICGLLVFVVIGILGLIALGICGTVFSIVGAVKANDNQVFRYPFYIKFF